MGHKVSAKGEVIPVFSNKGWLFSSDPRGKSSPCKGALDGLVNLTFSLYSESTQMCSIPRLVPFFSLKAASTWETVTGWHEFCWYCYLAIWTIIIWFFSGISSIAKQTNKQTIRDSMRAGMQILWSSGHDLKWQLKNLSLLFILCTCSRSFLWHHHACVRHDSFPLSLQPLSLPGHVLQLELPQN